VSTSRWLLHTAAANVTSPCATASIVVVVIRRPQPHARTIRGKTTGHWIDQHRHRSTDSVCYGRSGQASPHQMRVHWQVSNSK